MTEERRAEIRARVEAATPGPWGCVEMTGTILGKITAPNHMEYLGKFGRDADGQFIAHARQDIPDLLDEVERLGRSGRADYPPSLGGFADTR